MANILEIKPLIRNLIVKNLDERFGENIYWIGERQNIPQSPYCTLSVISENKDKRTSEHGKEKAITTLYKTAVITISVYNYAIGDNYDIEKEFAYREANKLERLFEVKSTHLYFYNLDCSIQNISSIRPLHEEVEGGYEYRYEFDLTIGFNETNISNVEIGKGVNVDMNNSEIKFTALASFSDENVDIEIS